MRLQGFEWLLKTEKRAWKQWVKQCWKSKPKFCIKCGHKKVYHLSRRRYRCAECRYTFTDFTGRWIGQLNITSKQWFWIVKLFELEVPSLQIAQQVELSYPTVLKATHLIRMSILAHAQDFRQLKGEVELDESYFGGRRKGGIGRSTKTKTPVFGLLERDGKVWVEIVKDVSAKSLLNETIKKVRRGSIVYTDKFMSYDSLMFCGYRHLKVDHRRRFARGKVYINGLEGFWSFAKQRLIKFHGVSPKRFIYYLKEMEFRFNHRQKNLFPILVRYVADLVSNPL
jgi:transposase